MLQGTRRDRRINEQGCCLYTSQIVGWDKQTVVERRARGRTQEGDVPGLGGKHTLWRSHFMCISCTRYRGHMVC